MSTKTMTRNSQGSLLARRLNFVSLWPCGSNMCLLFRVVAYTLDMHRLLSDLALESAKKCV